MTEVSFSSTPNPNALRCDAPGARWPLGLQHPGTPATNVRTLRSYRSAAAALAAGDDFAHELLMIPEVSGVLVHDGWLTVTKTPEAKWPPIKRAVTTLIRARARAGQP